MAQPCWAEEFSAKWEKIVGKAWKDEAYKRRLVADPAAVLKEEGLEPPKDTQVRIMEDTPNVVHLALRAKPSMELSEEDLLRVVGGGKAIGGRIWGGTQVLQGFQGFRF
jgi:Nitrile hydratase, alpha chain